MALDFGKLNFSTSFNPTSAFPIDARTYFESYEEAEAAAASAEEAGSSSTTYYYGQILTVYESDAVAAYQITPSKTLVKMAETTATGDLEGDVQALQTQVANIIDGSQVVGAAESDAEGNVISDTYATKTEVEAVQSDVTEAQSDITAIQEDVAELQEQIGGLSGAMHYVGVSTTDPSTGTVTVEGVDSFESGDVCVYESKEYVYDGNTWRELGDESSFALKTTTINGQPLSANVTLNASDVGADAEGTAAGLIANLTLDSVSVGANQTINAIAQANGVISVTTTPIQIEQSQVTGLEDALANTISEANVNSLIESATINASQINGAVANANYAESAGSVGGTLTISVDGANTTFNGASSATVSINIPVYTGSDAISVEDNAISIVSESVTNDMLAGSISSDKISSVSTDAFVQGDEELIINGNF